MDRRQCKQTWNRRVVFVNASIGKDQQCVPGFHRQRCAFRKLVQRRSQSRFAISSAEQRWQSDRQQISARNPAQLFQVAIRKNGMGQLQGVAILRRLIEDIALSSDVADERHHHLFADRIDRRVRDLRKQLFEVIEQRLGLVA